ALAAPRPRCLLVARGAGRCRDGRAVHADAGPLALEQAVHAGHGRVELHHRRAPRCRRARAREHARRLPLRDRLRRRHDRGRRPADARRAVRRVPRPRGRRQDRRDRADRADDLRAGPRAERRRQRQVARQRVRPGPDADVRGGPRPRRRDRHGHLPRHEGVADERAGVRRARPVPAGGLQALGVPAVRAGPGGARPRERARRRHHVVEPRPALSGGVALRARRAVPLVRVRPRVLRRGQGRGDPRRVRPGDPERLRRGEGRRRDAQAAGRPRDGRRRRADQPAGRHGRRARRAGRDASRRTVRPRVPARRGARDRPPAQAGEGRRREADERPLRVRRARTPAVRPVRGRRLRARVAPAL
ncbi:MAG: Glycerophosphoryl diester phosphodiesterase, partial [uncultured Solirubrobacteraceae bacterium]